MYTINKWGHANKKALTFGVKPLWHSPYELAIRLSSRILDLLPSRIWTSKCDVRGNGACKQDRVLWYYPNDRSPRGRRELADI
jgi:hypothetical protein